MIIPEKSQKKSFSGKSKGHCCKKRPTLWIGHNEKTYIGGNIGHGIDEPYRGHHFAAKACMLLFRLAEKHGMNYLTVSCQPSNKASSKTCEIAGGEYVGTANIPEDHKMYAKGYRQVMVYRCVL